jgi:hypothetical protein
MWKETVWHNLKYHSGICPQRLRITMDICQDSPCPGGDFNLIKFSRDAP